MLTSVLEVALHKANPRLVPFQAARIKLTLGSACETFNMSVMMHLRSPETDDFHVPIRCLMDCSGIQLMESLVHSLDFQLQTQRTVYITVN